MMLQLNPMLPVWNEDKGTGYAFAMIDYSQEHDILYCVAFDSGEIWTFPNHKLRVQSNISMGRIYSKQDSEKFIAPYCNY